MENIGFDEETGLYMETVDNTIGEQEVIPSPTPSNNMADHLLNLFATPQFMAMLKATINQSLEQSGASTSSTKSTDVASETEKTKQLPAFSIPAVENSDKLRGHANFRTWKQKLERDMVALGRFDFLKHPLGGPKCKFSIEERRMYDAQTRQYLDATLLTGPKQLVVNEATAADAFSKLEQMFGKNDIQKMVELLDNFGKVVLHPRMNPMAFVTRFENSVQQFRELGVPLDDKIVVAYFLHKVRHVKPFMPFYATIVTLPEETRTYEFVRSAFLDIAPSMNGNEYENSKYREDNTVVCYDCDDDFDLSFRSEGNDIITVCSICLGFPERSDSYDNSISVLCSQCGESSINDCDVCTGDRDDRFGEPSRKRERLMPPSQTRNEYSSVSSPYSSQQLEKIKRMTSAERKAARCHKCGLLFHREADCKHSGRVCYVCFKTGHEKKDCRKLKTLRTKN